MEINLNKHSMAWRIRATFAGKLPPKQYITRDIRRHDPGWASEPFSRPIEMLELFLPTGHRLILAGMERYNFFVEAVQSTRTRGKAQIKAFWLCGKLPGNNIVEMWRIGDGSAVRARRPWGKEWGGGPTSGWKQGATGGTLIAGIDRG